MTKYNTNKRPQASYKKYKTTTNKKLVVIIVIACVLVVAAALLIAYLATRNDKDAPKSPDNGIVFVVGKMDNTPTQIKSEQGKQFEWWRTYGYIYKS